MEAHDRTQPEQPADKNLVLAVVLDPGCEALEVSTVDNPLKRLLSPPHSRGAAFGS